jgi:putative proteasome-type protease
VLLTAGNLSLTQSVVSLLNEQLVEREEEPDAVNLYNVPSMYRAARLVGDAVRAIRAIDGPALEATKTGFSGSFILGGQIGKEPPRLFQIYSEGNFIEATDETPFFQTGEAKYGKPIIDRVLTRSTSLADATKCVLVSFDSTMRSNLSVGMPIDLLVYERDALEVRMRRRFEPHDPYFEALSKAWSEGTREVFSRLPELSW